MFESYYIQLKYHYPTIIIHLIEYTGLRYNIIDIYVRKSGDFYYYDKKYERYIKKYNLKSAMDKEIEIINKIKKNRTNKTIDSFINK